MRAFFDKTILYIKRAMTALFAVKPLQGIRLTFFVALVALGVSFAIHPAFAQSTGSFGGDVADWLVTGVTSILLVTARLAIGLCIFFLHFFITLASYNNYINTPVVQVGWIMVRDVANMFFCGNTARYRLWYYLGTRTVRVEKGSRQVDFGSYFYQFQQFARAVDYRRCACVYHYFSKRNRGSCRWKFDPNVPSYRDFEFYTKVKS